MHVCVYVKKTSRHQVKQSRHSPSGCRHIHSQIPLQTMMECIMANMIVRVCAISKSLRKKAGMLVMQSDASRRRVSVPAEELETHMQNSMASTSICACYGMFALWVYMAFPASPTGQRGSNAVKVFLIKIRTRWMTRWWWCRWGACGGDERNGHSQWRECVCDTHPRALGAAAAAWVLNTICRRTHSQQHSGYVSLPCCELPWATYIAGILWRVMASGTRKRSWIYIYIHMTLLGLQGWYVFACIISMSSTHSSRQL
jgi:hypothetical protein